ncbi:hypothetical protein ACO0LB_12365 [Undibacterium sp. SXout7W]|uniref:hypothetical protein n=1 Tax=Undibacterium sp. SXout7W TaxID=3413049 RepID=UPI003BF3D71E
MTRLVRLLLCMLMLAIPLQGLAAVTMVKCGVESHPEFTVNMSPHGLHSQHHDVTTDKVSEKHSHSLSNSVSKNKCSSCANCGVCSGAVALLMTFVESDNVSLSSEKIIQTSFTHSGHISNVPERPPKA